MNSKNRLKFLIRMFETTQVSVQAFGIFKEQFYNSFFGSFIGVLVVKPSISVSFLEIIFRIGNKYILLSI
jgi:hypothetical protein